MWFRNNKSNDNSKRARQQGRSGGLGARPVFSYHAQSARSEPASDRRTVSLPWASDAAKSSPRQDQQRRLPRRVLLISAIILVAALGLYSLFLARDPAIVVHPQADGRQLLLRSEDAYREAARAALERSITSTNKLTIDTGKVAQEIQKQFPELGRVSVVLPIVGRQPVVHLQTARPALVLVSSLSGGVFLVDESGRAVMDASKASDAVKQNLPVVEDQSGLSVTVGGGVLPKSNIDFITEVMGQLSAKDVKVVSLVLPAGTSELDIRVEGAPYMVKFNLRGDARAEAGAFLAVRQHLERENKTAGSYIDVRVPNKAYYQ